MDGRVLYDHKTSLGLDTTDVREVLPLGSVLASAPGISFVVLELTSATGERLSHNVYWMAPNKDFTGLGQMPRAKVDAQVLSTAKTATEYRYTIRFRNTSGNLAFFLNPQVFRGGEEVMPSFWSDNYFSLTAGGSTTVTVSVPAGKGDLSLVLDGWNVNNTMYERLH